MYIDTTFPPPGSGRLAQFMRLVDAFERDEIEFAADALIARLDAVNGDPDVEPNGDEHDQSYPEARSARGISLLDPRSPLEDAEDDDEPEDDDEDTGIDDVPHDDEGNTCVATWPETADQTRLSLVYDSDLEDDHPDLRAAHRRHIQRTRCDVVQWPDRRFYRLRDGQSRIGSVRIVGA